jgi:hypothetical protein
MAGIEIRRFDDPDERRAFERGRFEVVTLGGVTVGRASYEPGWVWSEHVGKPAGQDLCQIEHVGLVVSGRTGVRMADETEAVLSPGDVFFIQPGHDSWVIGDEPYVSLHFLGATEYARADDGSVAATGNEE